MSTNIDTWYNFVLQQMAAESNLNLSTKFGGVLDIPNILMYGSNNPSFQGGLTPTTPILDGATRMTVTQAEDFLNRYEIISHLPNTASGFSGTLMRERATGAYTIAFRSTEYLNANQGGDWERDGLPGADGEILLKGFALGQIASMESYYEHLQRGESYDATSGQWVNDPALVDFKSKFGADGTGGVLNVSGYSLSGNLASVFTALHPEVSQTYVYNAAGLGKIGQGDLQAMVTDLRARLAAAGINVSDPSNANLYAPNSQPDLPTAYQLITTGLQLNYNTSYNVTGSSSLAESRISQLYGQGAHNDSQKVANTGIHVPATRIFIEDQPDLQNWVFFGQNGDFATTHSITLLIDSLAAMRVFEKLGMDLSTSEGLEASYNILAAGTNERATGFIGTNGVAERDSLESIVSGLHKLLVGSDITFKSDPGVAGFGNLTNRDEFYSALDALNQKIATAGTLSFESLVGKTANDLVLAATNPDPTSTSAIAYRYALKALNPFAVTGAEYQTLHNTNGELNPYEPSNRTGNLTQQWIEDRAVFLSWKVLANGEDTATLRGPAGPDNYTFTDLLSDYTVDVKGQVLGTDSRATPNLVKFGGDDSDSVIGGPERDWLYSLGGTDYLKGKSGDDHLEGGAGLDVYQYNATELGGKSNDGNDTILDTDGRGVLRYHYNPGLLYANIDTIIADASVKLSNDQWRSADGRFTYTRQGTDLRVSLNDSAGGSMLLENWQGGDFHIHLMEERAPPKSTRDIVGDREYLDSDPAADGIQSTRDDLGNYVVTDVPIANHDDVLYGDRPDSPVELNAPGEHIVAGGGHDVIFADLPTIKANNSLGNADWIEAGEGRDSVIAGSGNDYIEGGFDGRKDDRWGGDLIDAGAGDDIVFGDYRMTLAQAVSSSGFGTPSELKGDFLYGGTGDDWLIAGSSDDILNGGPGRDLIVGGAGDDVIDGDVVERAVQLDWTLTRSIANQDGHLDYIVTIVGSELEYGQDVDAGDADVIYAGVGIDVIYGRGGDDYIDAGSDDDFVFGGAGADVLIGGGGNDYLAGDKPAPSTSDAADYLDGGAGNDTLWGAGGDDVLIGGAGNDILIGGLGKDTYIFSKGDGVETIFDTSETANVGEKSVIIFGDDIKPADIKFRLGSLMIDLGGGDEIHFVDFNPDDPLSTVVLGEIRFSDGASMTYQDVLDQGFDIDGTAGADNGYTGLTPMLVGTAVTDRIRGFAGNDVLAGLAGDDILDGGAGADFLQGGAGNDAYLIDNADSIFDIEGRNTILFTDATQIDDVEVTNTVTSGTKYFNLSIDRHDFVVIETVQPAFESIAFIDGSSYSLDALLRRRYLENQFLSGDAADNFLQGYSGNDFLNGNGGNDILLGHGGSDNLVGGTGNDWLEGGEGNDVLQGQAGEDVYILGRSDGFDLVVDFENSPENTNVIRWKQGVRPDDVVVGRNDNILEGSVSYDGLSLILDGDADQVVVANWFIDGVNKFIRVEFDDGTQWEEADLLAKLSVSTEARDYLVGTSDNDTLDGLSGDDEIWGDAGNDTIFGQEGSDHIRGGRGDDFISGGAGNDVLVGGAGNDVYWFDVGFGQDIVNDFDDSDPFGTDDVVRFAPGIAPQDVTVTRDPDTYITLSLDGTADRIFLPPEHLGEQGRVERVEFADGTVWDETYLYFNLFPRDDFIFGAADGDSIDGLGGNDTLIGLGGDETPIGGRGNNVLDGRGGNYILIDSGGNTPFDVGVGKDTMRDGANNDLFIGGLGNDTITTGLGADIIAFNAGHGRNLINASKGADNTLSLGGGIQYTNLTFTKSGADLMLNTGGTDKLTLAGWYTGTTNKSVVNLQVIAEAMSGYNPGGSGTPLDNKVEQFNFAALANAFDAAGQVNGWALTNALLSAHLSGSDTAAIGGDLAYQYGKSGSLSGIGLTPAQDVLNSRSSAAARRRCGRFRICSKGQIRLS